MGRSTCLSASYQRRRPAPPFPISTSNFAQMHSPHLPLAHKPSSCHSPAAGPARHFFPAVAPLFRPSSIVRPTKQQQLVLPPHPTIVPSANQPPSLRRSPTVAKLANQPTKQPAPPSPGCWLWCGSPPATPKISQHFPFRLCPSFCALINCKITSRISFVKSAFSSCQMTSFAAASSF
jgi:hypothetical protein